MQEYLIIAYDYPNALERRLAVREKHLALMRELKASGNFIAGGAILNESRQMIGSSLIIRFESRGDLDRWLAQEPYLTEKVWENPEIKPFRVAAV